MLTFIIVLPILFAIITESIIYFDVYDIDAFVNARDENIDALFGKHFYFLFHGLNSTVVFFKVQESSRLK